MLKSLNRWKNMKKSTKVGLVSSMVYAASSLALPAFAATKQEPVVIQPLNLESISTVKDANNLFHSKLKEYSADKELNSGEIRNLYSILMEEKELLDEGKYILNDKYLQAQKEVNQITQKRSKLEEELKNLEKPNAIFLNYLSEKKKKLHDSLNRLYPGILDKTDTDLNISYPAHMDVDNITFQDLIKEISKDINYKLNLEYDDKILEIVSGKIKDEYTLRDVALLLKTIDVYETRLKKSADLLKRELLKKELKDLKLQEKNIWQKILGNEKKEDVDLYLKSQADNAETSRRFSDYVAFEDRAKEFIIKFGDWNKYWSGSVLKREIVRDKAPKLYLMLNKNNQRSIEDAINQHIKSAGLEAKVKKLKNPRLYKFPLWWCILANGFLAPIIRNLLITKYMNTSSASEPFYGLSFAAGLGNGSIGLLLTDGLHPLAFWARMATPLLIQPAKRIFKID